MWVGAIVFVGVCVSLSLLVAHWALRRFPPPPEPERFPRDVECVGGRGTSTCRTYAAPRVPIVEVDGTSGQLWVNFRDGRRYWNGSHCSVVEWFDRTTDVPRALDYDEGSALDKELQKLLARQCKTLFSVLWDRLRVAVY